jgi:hypothetical protein
MGALQCRLGLARKRKFLSLAFCFDAHQKLDPQTTSFEIRVTETQLFAPFRCALPKSYPGAATVLLDEFDAGRFKRTTNGQIVSRGH